MDAHTIASPQALTGATHGVLVLTSEGGEDFAPIAAQVIRVLL